MSIAPGLIGSFFSLVDVLGLRGSLLSRSLFDMLALKVIDSRSNITWSLSAYESAVAGKPHPLIMFMWGPEELRVLSPRYAEDNVINCSLAVGGRESYYKCENNMAQSPTLEDCSCDMARYLIMEGAKKTGHQPTKFGYLTVNIPAVCAINIPASVQTVDYMLAEATKNPFIKFMESNYDVEVVGSERISLEAVDCTPQLVRLRDAGCDVLWLTSMTSVTAIVAKCAYALGLTEEKMKIIPILYAAEKAAFKLGGKEKFEGWITPWHTFSVDMEGMPGVRGTEKFAKLMQIAGLKVEPAEAVLYGGIALAMQDIAGIAKLVDEVGGWSGLVKLAEEEMGMPGAEAIKLYMDDPNNPKVKLFMSKMIEVLMGCLTDYNNWWDPMLDNWPVTFLPGKTTTQNNLIAVIRNGVPVPIKRPTGKYWEWVPPLLIEGPGPCPPNGWAPPPLEGSIDYGYLGGVWTFDGFVAEYDVPLWWAIMQYGTSPPDYKFQKDLVYQTLDRYFEAKKATPQEKVGMLANYVNWYNLPSELVNWVEEYGAS